MKEEPERKQSGVGLLLIMVTIMFKREKDGIRGLKRMLWPPEP